MTERRDVQPDCADVLDGLRRAGVLDEEQHSQALTLVWDREREREKYNEDFHPNRRRSDRLPWWVGAIWRNLVPVISLGLAVYAVAGTQRDVINAKQLAVSQQEGRGVAIAFLCGFGNGVSAAGQNVILGPLEERKAQGKRERSDRRDLAESWRRQISDYVVAEVRRQGIKIRAADVTTSRGLLDCGGLQRASRAG